MSNTDRVTLRDIYDRFDRFEDRMDRRFAELEEKVGVIQRVQDNLTGKLTAGLAFLSIAMSLVIEFVKEKIIRS